MKSKAAILWEVNTPWSVEETEIGRPRDNEVVIRLASSGLCHSDDHCVKNDLPTNLPRHRRSRGGRCRRGSRFRRASAQGRRSRRHGLHPVLRTLSLVRRVACPRLCDYGAVIMEGYPITDGKPRVARPRGRGCVSSPCSGRSRRTPWSTRTPASRSTTTSRWSWHRWSACGVATGFGAAVNRAEVGPGDTVVVGRYGRRRLERGTGCAYRRRRGHRGRRSVRVPARAGELLGATHAVASMEEAMPLVTELTRGVMADKTIMTASPDERRHADAVDAAHPQGGRPA